MADNVPITAGTGTVIATDELVINALTVQAQIIKPIFGPLDTATFITATVGMPTNPVQIAGNAILTGNGVTGPGSMRVTIASDNSTIPVYQPDITATGTITTQNLVMGGVATAGSAVSMTLFGRSSLSIQVTGTYTGGLALQGTVDNVNWVTLGAGNAAPLLNVNTGVLSGTIPSAAVGIYQTDASAFVAVRVTAPLPVTGTATVTLEAGQATGVVTISNQSLPTTNATEAAATFRGKVQSYVTPGRAGTAGQKIFAIHNATGSTKVVHINQIVVDLVQTVVKAVTVQPPVIRVHRFTALPTNGTGLAKLAKDTNLTSNSSITIWNDASGDNTSSASALTVTLVGNALTQEFAPRLITAAGYEMFDRTTMLDGADIVLRALEGLVVFLSYTAATQNPITDMWTVGCDWYEV